MLLKNTLCLAKMKLTLMNKFKQTLISVIIVVLFAATLFFSACDDTVTSAEVDKVIIPDSNVDYYEYIQPVFNIKCATSLCHDDGTRASGLSLTTYSNATARLDLVFPGDADGSPLVWAIEGTGGVFMPPRGATPPLTDNQIQGIRTWIDEGAKPKASNP